MPGLKQLGPVPQQPKKRLERGALSSASISAPLGDFRHTLHVGRGGDTFGDTSFLGHHQARGSPPEAQPQPGEPLAAPPPPSAADPLLTFHLDLGPSMLDAVLGVMDTGHQGVTAQPQGDPRTGLPPSQACSQQREPELEPHQHSVTSL
ncbi:cdc42 effector protein 5 [Suncus etruscus]|uniref:cdc42 effector protein 5 n=1 Tax=Suncus etruscus TaxID=109475 RepID=UPI00211014E6|nr:cdc42 effector protein 5 [Suncus etruscus]